MQALEATVGRLKRLVKPRFSLLCDVLQSPQSSVLSAQVHTESFGDANSAIFGIICRHNYNPVHGASLSEIHLAQSSISRHHATLQVPSPRQEYFRGNCECLSVVLLEVEPSLCADVEKRRARGAPAQERLGPKESQRRVRGRPRTAPCSTPTWTARARVAGAGRDGR